MELKSQLVKLSEQVAALAAVQSLKHQSQIPAVSLVMGLAISHGSAPVNVFLGQQEIADDVFAVDNWAISKKIVARMHRCRVTSKGCPGWATGIPHKNWPRLKHIKFNYYSSHQNKRSCCHWSAGGVTMELMLDSGSAVPLVRKDMMSPQCCTDSTPCSEVGDSTSR